MPRRSLGERVKGDPSGSAAQASRHDIAGGLMWSVTFLQERRGIGDPRPAPQFMKCARPSRRNEIIRTGVFDPETF
jgi:hypothetical protein